MRFLFSQHVPRWLVLAIPYAVETICVILEGIVALPLEARQLARVINERLIRSHADTRCCLSIYGFVALPTPPLETVVVFRADSSHFIRLSVRLITEKVAQPAESRAQFGATEANKISVRSRAYVVAVQGVCCELVSEFPVNREKVQRNSTVFCLGTGGILAICTLESIG
jgi:hypothetical protein